MIVAALEEERARIDTALAALRPLVSNGAAPTPAVPVSGGTTNPHGQGPRPQPPPEAKRRAAQGPRKHMTGPTTELRARGLALFGRGKSTREVASECLVSYQTAYGWRRAAESTTPTPTTSTPPARATVAKPPRPSRNDTTPSEAPWME